MPNLGKNTLIRARSVSDGVGPPVAYAPGSDSDRRLNSSAPLPRSGGEGENPTAAGYGITLTLLQALDDQRGITAARQLESQVQFFVSDVQLVRRSFDVQMNGKAERRPFSLGEEHFADAFHLHLARFEALPRPALLGAACPVRRRPWAPGPRGEAESGSSTPGAAPCPGASTWAGLPV